jgi:cysteine sulfinate desulfinase/cysteine desulfurase-like protein
MQPLLTLIKLLAILQVDGMVKKVMAANNEVGTLYPVEVVARIAAQGGARTLIDTTQAAERVPM